VDVTLTASATNVGSGANYYWYTGPNGTGTLLGTGASVTITTTVTMTIYARLQGTCNTSADASVVINVKNFVYAPNGSSTTTYCTDNAGWHHFYVGNDIIFSVLGDLSGTSTVTASINVNGTYYQQTQGPGTAPACVTNTNPGEERFEMKRSWNLNLGGGTPIGTYQVRFYYLPSERTAIETAAINWMATYSACGYTYKYAVPLGFYWFKNTGSNYTAPIYDATHYAATIGTTPNGVNYSQWSGIPSFSGGSGAVILIPIVALPITINSFTAICENNNSARIQWVTNSENNTSHFQIERSIDGTNWELLGETAAAGNSSNLLTYEMEDQDVRGHEVVYYRLKQFDLNGTFEVFGSISVECKADLIGFDVHPNPAGSNVTIVLYGEIPEGSTSLSFFDIQGKEVKKINYSKETGKLLNVDLEGMATGCYIIKMVSGDKIIQPVRLIKQ
jgi:hypothetical protein